MLFISAMGICYAKLLSHLSYANLLSQSVMQLLMIWLLIHIYSCLLMRGRCNWASYEPRGICFSVCYASGQLWVLIHRNDDKMKTGFALYHCLRFSKLNSIPTAEGLHDLRLYSADLKGNLFHLYFYILSYNSYYLVYICIDIFFYFTFFYLWFLIS